jgi:hypothetical protein
VKGDAGLACEVHEWGRVSRNDVLDGTRSARYLDAPDPSRQVFAGVLLEDAHPVDPLRIALEVQWTPCEVRKHGAGYPLVVRRELELRDARSEQRLVGA